MENFCLKSSSKTCKLGKFANSRIKDYSLSKGDDIYIRQVSNILPIYPALREFLITVLLS